ncbi:MAG: tetratricopeptide repeat protein [Chloroflexota bacterium]
MSTLEINCLGDLKVVHDGTSITQEIPIKSQAILAYLATTQKEHSRHALAGLFWGDRSEEKAKNSLRVAINGLRKKIPDHLSITRQTLSLDQKSDLLLDIGQLAEVADVQYRVDLSHLAQATTVYRGDFLDGFALEDAPEFAEWLSQQRSYWRQIALQSLTNLVEHYLTDENYGEALRVLNRHLEIDPCSEEAHRRAMTAYSRKGDIAAALNQYRRCEEALSQILGVEPSPETVSIYTSLESAKRRPKPSLPSSPYTTSLIGRERELEQLRTLLSTPFSRLITVSGFGGIGKTQLVRTLIDELLDDDATQFQHGVLFVPLSGLESASLIPTATVDALNQTFTGQQSATNELIDELRNKEMLIVYDGFEHFLDSGIDFLNQLLAQCTAIKILVTSREWLNVAMEWRLNLEGLAYPDVRTNQSLDMIAKSSAVAFFLQEANRVRPGFQLDELDRQPICRLCNLVAGIPLALMLAANWLRTMSIEAIADEVERDLDILTSRVRNMPPRQRSMRAVFESTWSQLLPTEQEMFQALSVFRGGFTLEAISHLFYAEGDWVLGLDSLDALADKGLVQYQDEEDRYRVHELLRQCGADKLNVELQTKERIEQRHAQYYCGHLAKLEPMYKGGQQADALSTYIGDSENIYTAWQTATRTQQITEIANALDSLGVFCEWRGRFSDGLHLLEATRLMLQARSVMRPEPLLMITLARILAWISDFQRMVGQPEEAKAALDHCERLLNHELVAATEHRAARAFYALQRGHLLLDVDNQSTLRWYHESLSIYSALGMDWERASVLEALGIVQQSIGDLDAANDLIETSLSIRQQIGDQRGMANALAVLSSINRFQGDIQTAIRYARESNELYQTMDERSSMADGMQNLGMTLNSVGEYQEAMDLLESSLDIYRSLNNQRRLSMVHANASHVAGCLGQFDRASYHANETIRLGESSNDMRSVANGYTLLAWHAVVAGHFEQAITLVDKGRAISKRAGGHAESDIAYSILGYAYSGLGKQWEAHSIFVSLLHKCAAERDFLPLNTAVPKVVLLILEQLPSLPTENQEDWQRRAIVTYMVMKSWPVVGTSKLLETVVTQAVDDYVATLPTKLVDEIELVAQSIDIWKLVSELTDTLPTIGWTLRELNPPRNQN